MSVDNALGQTFTNGQVTTGTATLANGTYTYAENTAFTTASVLVGGEIHNSDGTTTLTFRYTANGSTPVITSGTVLGNTGSSILVSATINGTAEAIYLTNTSSSQPGVGATVPSIPAESSAPTYAAPCYCLGTLIRTANGDVPVEDLAVGDLVITISGELHPVRWIGTRAYRGRFFASCQAVWPIRFRAGSLGRDAAGAAVPSRDLLVSPMHGMFIDGVLVSAELLVNGSTIRRDGSAGFVSYYHVELSGHHAIWAENAASESFADDGSRRMFDNISPVSATYAGTTAEDPMFCAPRVTQGETLEAILCKLSSTTCLVLAA